MKETRTLSVYGKGDRWNRIPKLVLQGKWLSELGFKESDELEVICKDRQLIINNISK